MKPVSKTSVTNFFLLTLLLTLLTIPSTVNAFTIEKLNVELLDDFVLEPTKNEVILDPGETGVRKVSVINRTERTVDFKIEIEDIVGSDNPDDQVKLLGDEVGPHSLKNFLFPEVNIFTLRPGEKATINIGVNLPSNAEPRGYYGAIIVSAVDQETDPSEDVGVAKIVTRLGSIFLVRINGDAYEESSISEFKTIGLSTGVYSSHPKGFEVAIKNEGNVHLVHYGEITVNNLFGKTIASLPIDAFFSLPESTRFKESLWPKSFAIGYYTANLEIYKGFGEDDNFDNASISFWVLPWQIVLPIMVVIILLIILMNFIKKNFKISKK